MSSLILAEGSRNDRLALALQTRRQNDIPNAPRRQRTPSEMMAARQLWTGRFPTIEVRGSLSHYNCVGLVFGARRTAIDASEIDRILREDSYQMVDKAAVHVGDLVVYRDGDQTATHVGIVVEASLSRVGRELLVGRGLRILSQWGFDGEFLHSPTDVPEVYGRAEFWRMT